MAHPEGKYADFEGLRERATALRRDGYSLRQIRDELKIFNNDILQRLVKGEPPPEWTKRPNAKDDLRARARELRLQGWTYDRIRAELGCSKSSVSLWVRDLPAPEPKCTPEQQRARMNAGLARLRHAQELFFTGVALYWAEGAKDKPHRRTEVLQFINSDPADVEAAETFWADIAGVDASAFSKATLKRHNPRTVRKNTGDAYHGCLVIYVRQSADLYRRMEGAWYGIVGAATRRPD